MALILNPMILLMALLREDKLFKNCFTAGKEDFTFVKNVTFEALFFELEVTSRGGVVEFIFKMDVNKNTWGGGGGQKLS